MKRLLSTLFCLLLVVAAFAQRLYTIIEDGEETTFTAAELKGYVQKSMQERIKAINEQLPLNIDEITTLYSTLFIGNALYCNYRGDIDKTDYTQDEINQMTIGVKDNLKENIAFLYQSNSNKMPPKEWKRLFTELGIYYVYTYFDCNNKVFARFIIYPKDIDLNTK